MATEIHLKINGRMYNILRFNYEFHRQLDCKGRPTVGVQGGNIHIVMESGEDTSILEEMLSERLRQAQCPQAFHKNELYPISGKVQVINEDMQICRELIFDEGYIYNYYERMIAEGSKPMRTFFSISVTRLDIDRHIRMDRRIATTYGFWWEEYKKEEKKIIVPTLISEISKPTLLVTSVTGNVTALPRENVKYKVTGYNLSNVGETDRKRVKWVVNVSGKEEVQKEQGEVLKLLIKEEWAGEEISVMPYLKKPSDNVCQKTKVATCKHVDGAIMVAQYIVDEIKTNTKSKTAEGIRYYASEEEYKIRYEEWKKNKSIGKYLNPPEPQNLLKAKMLWTERVFAQRPWDHKPKIRDKFRHLAVERTHPQTQVVYKSYYHKYKDYDYFYDVWSNIHYGYVGLSVGFDEDTLLNGADLAQIIDSRGGNTKDTGDDKTSIKIGFALYYKHGKYAEGLTSQDILDALDAAIMTESKLRHVCFAK